MSLSEKKERIDEVLKLAVQKHTEVNEAIVKLAEIDNKLADPRSTLAENIESLRTQFLKDVEKLSEDFNKEHMTDVTLAETQETIISNNDEAIRRLLIEYYKLSGDQSVADELQVQIRKRKDFNEQDAIAWCIEHKHGEFLKINNRAFGKLITTGLIELSFVSIVDQITPIIKYIKIEEDKKDNGSK